MATAAIVSPLVCRLFPSHISLSIPSSLKFGVVEATIVCITHFALPFLEKGISHIPDKVDLQSIEQELGKLERSSIQSWKVKEEVTKFNVDEILDVLSEDDVIGNDQFKQIYSLDGNEIFDREVKRLFEQNLERYRKYVANEQEQEVKRYANKIFGYLIQKKRAWEAELEPQKRKEAFKKFCDLSEYVVKSFNDAHENCVDQALSQVENLAIMIVDDYGCSELQKMVALSLISYRNALIKEVVAQTREEHAADLERNLSKSIHEELGLPLPKCIQVGAAFGGCPSHRNFRSAKTAFLERYHPLKYLADQISYHSERQLFTAMCQWYNDKIFPQVDDDTQGRVVAQLGTDFLTEGFEKRTKASVLYFLLKNGIIEPSA